MEGERGKGALIGGEREDSVLIGQTKKKVIEEGGREEQEEVV